MDEHKKNMIGTWLPLMIELEKMGVDPIEHLFGDAPLTIQNIEVSYRALTICKEKYPIWYKVVSAKVTIMLKAG